MSIQIWEIFAIISSNMSLGLYENGLLVITWIRFTWAKVHISHLISKMV